MHCGPIYSIDVMFEDAQVRHFGVAQDVSPSKIVTSLWSAGHAVANPKPNGGAAAGIWRADR